MQIISAIQGHCQALKFNTTPDDGLVGPKHVAFLPIIYI